MKKKSYLLLTALLIGLSPPAKSAITLNFLKQKMIDYCIPKEGTNCTPSRQATYSSEDGGTCICGEGTEWIEDLRSCIEPCPAGSYIMIGKSSSNCPAGSYPLMVIDETENCLTGSYKKPVGYE